MQDSTRGLTDDVANFDFYEVSYGIMKRRTYRNGMIDEHPLIFPNILRQGNVGQIRVPMDDTHTKIYFVRFFPSENGEIIENDEPPVEYIKPYKNPPDALHPYTKFRMDCRAGAGPYGVGDSRTDRRSNARAAGDDRPRHHHAPRSHVP